MTSTNNAELGLSKYLVTARQRSSGDKQETTDHSLPPPTLPRTQSAEPHGIWAKLNFVILKEILLIKVRFERGSFPQLRYLFS